MRETPVLAVAMAVLLAAAAHGQSGLAPGAAVTPAERPEAPARAPLTEQPAEAPATALVPEGTPEQPATAPVPEQTPEAPATAPVPKQIPEAPPTAPRPKPVPEAPVTSPVPEEDQGVDPDLGAAAPAEAPAPAEPPVPELLAEDDATLAACLGRLRAGGTVFERADAVSEEGGACGILNPIRVSEIVAGVALEPAALMRCATAAALADWVVTFVLPASRTLSGQGPLIAVDHASTYVCRRIGGDGDLSQHAFGNAVDIIAFRFAEGPPVLVEPREREGTAAEAFQRTARASACLGFTTVIGPGQEDHDNHLHLDIKPRESGYRLCQ